jgi:cellulose synthase/poly-beta-1,6-N-acetylglucosamine synthase-like glycosyltransferase
MRSVLIDIVIVYNIAVLLYFLLINFSYLTLLLLAAERLFYFKRRRGIRICRQKECALAPGVAVLVPAYNEELTIVNSVLSLREIDYPELEIIIINDGSNDETLDRLKKEFKLFAFPRVAEENIETKPIRGVYRSAVDPRLLVIDKENGGKADALNAGLNYSRSRLYCAIDADSIIEKDAIKKLVQPYLEREAKAVAVGGIVRVANGSRIEGGEVLEAKLPRKFLPAIQVMEYIRAFLCGRTGWSRLESLLIISGAFGLFERKAVVQAGGYRTDTVGEDMELVTRLHRQMVRRKKPYRVAFVPDPVCWTQVPEKLGSLGAQRNRWQRGLIETVSRHRKMLFNPRYGTVGMIGMPFYLFFEMIGPIIEITGYTVFILSWILGILNWKFALLFFVLAVLFGVILSLFSLFLEEFTLKRYSRPKDIVRLFLLAVVENFGYRQLTSWWRLTAFFGLGRKRRAWGEMKRKAFTEEESK